MQTQRSPLHLAALNGHKGAVVSLCEHGASVGPTDSHGMTPLHKAVTQGFEDVVEELLERGLDPNAALPVRCD